MLTLSMLKDLPPHTMFAKGSIIDNPFGINLANTGKVFRWVAVRGDIPDWAIYAQNPHYLESQDPEVLSFGYGGTWSWSRIKLHGDKIFPRNAQQLVGADEEAMKMYRK